MTRHWRAIVITALSVLLVAAGLIAVNLRLPHAAAQPAPTAISTSRTGATVWTVSQPTVPPYPPADCDPAKVLPFKCGTYTSDYGGKHVTGTTGGPVKDPLQLSFTTAGGLVLHAASRSCLTASIPVAYRHGHLVRTAAGRYGESNCHGPGPNRADWAWAFLTRSTLTTDDGTTYGRGDDSVFFQYDGIAALGRPQLPRNDLKACISAHIAPFHCATYHSTAGTGSLAFLSTSRYRLTFEHINAELELELFGHCNGLQFSTAVDHGRLVTSSFGSTLMACLGAPGRDDHALSDFFDKIVAFDQHGDRVTFTGPHGTATFTLAQ